MNLKPVTNQVVDNQPKFIMSGKNLEWSVGQVTLDASKFQEGQALNYMKKLQATHLKLWKHQC